ncbi:MAG TPA: ribonuclease D [Coriobacteriia bacterium]|nr:ribonuclease D [Coriobacteriia bacterium]
MYVDTSEALNELVSLLEGAVTLAIDTEFMRERTYYARLCLIQIATDDVTAIIDPLSIRDLEPLFAVFRNPAVTKVFHAGSQDLEILYRLMGTVPAPVFDTQTAATLLGMPTQVSYQQLVHSLLGVSLGKGHTYTDWAARPLSAEQVDYALDDVRYLPSAYRTMRERLEGEGRLAWLEQDFARMADSATYEVVPEEQYRRVKRASSLDRRSLAILRELAAWREFEAQRRDLPKRWVVSDEALLEIARRTPADSQALQGVRGLNEQVARRHAGAILGAINRGREIPDDELPRLPKRKRLEGDVSDITDLLSALLRLRAREHGVAPTLIATRDELERFAAGERDESPLGSGWRHTLVGAELAELLDGRISLAAERGRIVVNRVDHG